MKYRTLGKTGVAISEVGLGTWQLGGSDWGQMPDDDAMTIMRRSVELGVNFFDTADVYGGGRSEKLIGRFLKESGATLYVATKIGRREWIERQGWPTRFTMEMARRDVEYSLRNLGVETLFLEQFHCVPTDWIRSGEIFELMEQLQRQGKIRHWGCSVESVEEGRLCMKHGGCASLQVIYNIFRQKLTTELLPEAKRQNVGVLARVPLASGLLSGKIKPGHKFAESDHRFYNADGQKFNVGETFAGVPLERGIALAQQIEAIVGRPGGDGQVTMAQQALRWVLDQDGVTSVIPGATKLAQAEANAGASDLPPLSQDVHQRLRELYDREIAGVIRGKY